MNAASKTRFLPLALVPAGGKFVLSLRTVEVCIPVMVRSRNNRRYLPI